METRIKHFNILKLNTSFFSVLLINRLYIILIEIEFTVYIPNRYLVTATRIAQNVSKRMSSAAAARSGRAERVIIYI